MKFGSGKKVGHKGGRFIWQLKDSANLVVCWKRTEEEPRHVEKMRMRLDLDLDKNEEDRLVFYFAERTSREDIEALHLEKAKEIYILGEDVHADNEEDHDVFNISCLENISEYFKHVILKDKKKVHVSLEYQSTFTAFKSTHIYKSLARTERYFKKNVFQRCILFPLLNIFI